MISSNHVTIDNLSIFLSFQKSLFALALNFLIMDGDVETRDENVGDDEDVYACVRHEHFFYVFSFRPRRLLEFVQDFICPEEIQLNNATFKRVCEGDGCTYVCEHPNPVPCSQSSSEHTNRVCIIIIYCTYVLCVCACVWCVCVCVTACFCVCACGAFFFLLQSLPSLVFFFFQFILFFLFLLWRIP